MSGPAHVAGPFWVVPAEMAIALASDSIRMRVDRRRAGGEDPKPNATVFRRGGRLWALIDFKAGASLQFVLSAFLTENA